MYLIVTDTRPHPFARFAVETDVVADINDIDRDAVKLDLALKALASIGVTVEFIECDCCWHYRPCLGSADLPPTCDENACSQCGGK